MNQCVLEGLSKPLQTIESMELLLDINEPVESVIDWVNESSEEINNIIQTNGAILIRGLNIQSSKKLEKVLTTLFGEALLEYVYRSTPRTKMRGRIYTSSEYHADETILLHNENAYSNRWPMRIAFCCVKAAETGGATPIADSRAVYKDIPEDIREEFERRQLLYVRNYSDIDLPWTEVFQTEDKAQVSKYCEENDVELEWLEDGKLRTKQRTKASCIHPVTGEKLWFNQAHLFHISSQSEELRNSLLSVVGMENLPRNVYYGDGGIIDDEIIATIRKVYEKHLIAFNWKEGDLLLLDNMLFAHGREPFSGSRKILTGMSKPMSAANKEFIEQQIGVAL